MEEDELDWWWFDMEECWEDLHELWTGWELRNNLMHSSWTLKGEKGLELMDGREGDGGTNWSNYP